MTGSNLSDQIIIIGAGPIGLEAALYARQLGYSVRILERGIVAENMQRWGHVRLFSPFAMNCSALGRKALEGEEISLTEDSAYLTGREYRKKYVLPLADYLRQETLVTTGCEVLAITRLRTLKNEYIGNPQRQKQPFKLLVRYDDGREEFLYADVVIDASGSYANPNWLGDGGIPALGEQAHRERIDYGLVDIAGAERKRFENKTTLLVGDGHSAANSIVALRALFDTAPETRVLWAIRKDKDQPVAEVPEDVLAERARISHQANHLSGHPRVELLKQTTVIAIVFDPDAQEFEVTLETPRGVAAVRVDNIIANTGFSPDNRIYSELQVHECYASRGPMKLAAALLAESSSTDCLTQSSPGPETLKNPEPNFFIIGMKSYGKNSNFLLKIGYEQIRDVFAMIGEAEVKAKV